MKDAAEVEERRKYRQVIFFHKKEKDKAHNSAVKPGKRKLSFGSINW